MEYQSDILKLCSNSNVFYRGQSIYKAEHFTDVEEDKTIDYEYECPAYVAYPGMCKHCAARGLYWFWYS